MPINSRKGCNNDGLQDLAVANGSGNSAAILEGTPDGLFNLKASYPIAGNPVTVVSADFNNDINPDLAVTTYSPGRLAVLLGQGDSSFGPPVIYEMGGLTTVVIAEDLDGDQVVDLAAVNGGSQTITILRGNGSGTFELWQTISTASFQTIEPNSLVAGYFDDDEFKDLAVVFRTSSTFRVFFGSHSGDFEAGPVYSSEGRRPRSLATADFNQDTILDLAIANIGDGSIGNVSIFLGDESGGFNQVQQFWTGQEPRFLLTGFFDL